MNPRNTADLIRLFQWVEHNGMAHVVPNIGMGSNANVAECGVTHAGRLLMKLKGAALENTRPCHLCVKTIAPHMKAGTVGELTGATK